MAGEQPKSEETAQPIVLTYKGVVTALLKDRGIHDGIWGLYVKFGLKAANIGEGPETMVPAAILPVVELGLQKFDQETNIAVDAAKVNPAKKKRKVIRRK